MIIDNAINDNDTNNEAAARRVMIRHANIAILI